MSSRFRLLGPRFLAAALLMLGSSAVQAGPVQATLDSLGAGTNLFIHYEAPGSNTFQDWHVFAGQYHMHLAGGPEFNSFCVDLNHTVTVGQSFQVSVQPNMTGVMAGGEVAYLYQKYGVATLSNNVMAAALQIALWKLSVDGNGSLTSGNFQYLGADAVAAAATTFLTEAATHTAGGNWLDASASGDGRNRGQSVMVPTPEPATVVLLGLGLTGVAGWRRWRRQMV
jgi:hypothetical protein